MEDTYFYLVLAKERTCDESNKIVKLVPITCRAVVSAMLTERGYDLNGNKVV
ncbi:hypothetical protein [Anaerotignum sp.]|uniref:hypothetical protein n=1 Tax=Anaerotignum sp. TaxID=2039241 RepID=UPI0033231176